MSLPLSGLRLWMTRPQPAATRSCARWEEAGAECVVLPAVAIVGRELSKADQAELSAAMIDALVVLTSANAARYLVEAASQADQLEPLLDRPAAAVGETTAQAATDLGFNITHVGHEATGEALALSLVDEGPLPKVLLPGSDRRRPDVERLLREHGVEVVAITVYETVPIAELDEAAWRTVDDVTAISLYSPSAVAGIAAAATARGRSLDDLAPCLALGPTTARAVGAAGLHLATEAVLPGEEGLLDAAIRWWGETRNA